MTRGLQYAANKSQRSWSTWRSSVLAVGSCLRQIPHRQPVAECIQSAIAARERRRKRGSLLFLLLIQVLLPLVGSLRLSARILSRCFGINFHGLCALRANFNLAKQFGPLSSFLSSCLCSVIGMRNDNLSLWCRLFDPNVRRNSFKGYCTRSQEHKKNVWPHCCTTVRVAMGC